MELIAVVMGSTTSQERFAACKSMLDYGFANYALYTPALQEGASVPVTLGTQPSVAVVPGETTDLLIPKGQQGSVQADIALDPAVAAPVNQGQKLGTMTVRCGDQVLAQIPLVAQISVPRVSWGQMFRRLMGRILMAPVTADSTE
jgi:D-alanyl-D-alanine carboxypeptidase (penicillin-binding protein 5/6)